MRQTAKRVIAGAVVLLLIASACGDDDDDEGAAPTTTAEEDVTTTTTINGQEGQPATVFVGKVEGTDAYVALGTGEGPEDVVAYVCDGAELVAYLDGSQSGSSVTAAEPGGIELAATLEGDGASGQVTLVDGTVHRFTATEATGEAGYFRRAEQEGNETTLGGWIRLEDGSVRGTKQKIVLDPDNPDDVMVAGEQGGEVPPGAQPLAFGLGGAVRCGIAGFKFRRARDAFLTGTGSEAALNDALANVRNAC